MQLSHLPLGVGVLSPRVSDTRTYDRLLKLRKSFLTHQFEWTCMGIHSSMMIVLMCGTRHVTLTSHEAEALSSMATPCGIDHNGQQLWIRDCTTNYL